MFYDWVDFGLIVVQIIKPIFTAASLLDALRISNSRDRVENSTASQPIRADKGCGDRYANLSSLERHPRLIIPLTRSIR